MWIEIVSRYSSKNQGASGVLYVQILAWILPYFRQLSGYPKPLLRLIFLEEIYGIVLFANPVNICAGIIHLIFCEDGRVGVMRDLTNNAEDLGCVDEMEVIDMLVPVAGLNVLDVGCGNGRIARQLAERGAITVGVEPDPVQAEKNRVAEPVAGLTFIEAPGQALPISDNSMNGVFFSFSFHHIPREHMDAAIAEAVRVLKSDTGFLYVLEPMLVGSMEDVYRPFHDETQVRTQAYIALGRSAEQCFAEARELRYHETVHYDNFTTFVNEKTRSTYNNFSRDRVDTPNVRALFELGKTEDGYAFTQHSRVNLYLRPN